MPIGDITIVPAVIRVVTQRFFPIVWEKRCVTTLITAAKETRLFSGLETVICALQTT